MEKRKFPDTSRRYEESKSIHEAGYARRLLTSTVGGTCSRNDGI